MFGQGFTCPSGDLMLLEGTLIKKKESGIILEGPSEELIKEN